MSNVIFVARVTAKDGCIDKLLEVLQSLVAPSRAEEGCITYDLHQDVENENLFMFYEVWESESHFEAHGKTKHFLDATGQFPELTSDFSADKYKKV